MASRSHSIAPAALRQLCARPQRLPLFLHAPLARPVVNLNLNHQSFRAAHSIPRPPDPRTITKPKFDKAQVGEAPKSEGERPEIKPSHYQLSFTCVPCGHRSHHNVSKQGYHFGSTLITCPDCRNRHIISDHLNIFGDKSVTIEQILEKKGQLVKRGTLGEDGDIEFWPENSLLKGKGSDKNESSE